MRILFKTANYQRFLRCNDHGAALAFKRAQILQRAIIDEITAVEQLDECGVVAVHHSVERAELLRLLAIGTVTG
ncbi:hypothetical protein SDC9_168629 [bioreactor metagenome]|uniref:Uncharacterized protein n=1 Tax=bioreactor metagenome TaxID=1076179 RepID=A0A645G5P4_9ZZZZ